MQKFKFFAATAIFFTLSVPKVLSQTATYQPLPPPASQNQTQTIQTPAPVPQTPVVKKTQTGMSITIPSVGIDVPVINVGLESTGALHVPANTTQAGWYVNSAKPGDVGQPLPTIIDGHLDFGRNFTPGVFYNLHNIKIGDEIYVDRGDGTTAVFTVASMAQYPQSNFPTHTVYDPTPDAQLRVITCAGVYDPAVGHYTKDLVVYASLEKII